MVDVDSDKRTDLLLMNGERGKLVFWQQQQDGSLSNRGDLVNFTYSPGRCQFYPDQSRHSAIVLDYNHDGILDVLVKQTRWQLGCAFNTFRLRMKYPHVVRHKYCEFPTSQIAIQVLWDGIRIHLRGHGRGSFRKRF